MRRLVERDVMIFDMNKSEQIAGTKWESFHTRKEME